MGSWETLGPALLSLAGGALGAGGSLFGQYLVSRASTRQLEVQESAAHRAELKNAVLKFLGLVSLEKRVLARRPVAPRPMPGSASSLMICGWHAEIDLAARSEPLRGAAHRYVARLAEAARGGISDGSVRPDAVLRRGVWRHVARQP